MGSSGEDKNTYGQRNNKNGATCGPVPYFQTISFRPFNGSTLTTLRAGFALNIISSPVNGLVPLRALVAGLRMTLIFIRPGTV